MTQYSDILVYVTRGDMGVIERCVYTCEQFEKSGGGKCTLSFDSGVTIEVTNKSTSKIISELGHYGWQLIKIEKNKTKKSLFFERYIK